MTTMDALLAASDGELEMGSSHACAQGKDVWTLITSSLAAAGSADPSLRQRAAAELEQIQVVRERHARRIAIVPGTTEEPVGPARLLALARRREADSGEDAPVPI